MLKSHLLFSFFFVFAAIFSKPYCAFAQDSSITTKIWGNDRKAKTLFVDETYDFRASWLKIAKTDKERIEKLLEIVSKVPTGEKIVLKARLKAAEQGALLEDLITLGEGSLTDTTLLRRYLPSQVHKVSYEARSQVLINRSHNLQNAILDLSHELTHFSFRSAFNPYVVNFKLKDFIKSTIEGQGGEVDAYLVECKVFKETFSEEAWRSSNCHELTDAQGKLSRQRIVERFYQVGNQYKTLKKELEAQRLTLDDFPFVNDQEASYVSSAYGVPYPLAALREYTSIMEKSCLNDYKRMVLMRESNSRRPASQDEAGEQSQMTRDFKERCTEYLGGKSVTSF